MSRKILTILRESLQWLMLCAEYKINYKKVVLALAHENQKLDYYAVAYLEHIVRRKYAEEAIILFQDRESGEMIKDFQFPFQVKAVHYPREKMEKLYEYYSFDKFFDNIAFTYTKTPKYNLLGRVLEETSVNEQEAVCLALYHLREVVESEEKNVGDGYACYEFKAG